MKKKLKIDYDEVYDTLFLYSDEEYEKSIEKFNVVVDFTKSNSVGGVEFLEATSFLSKFFNKKFSKKELKNLKQVFLEVKNINNLLFIQINLKLKERILLVPLTMENPNLSQTC